MGTLFLVVLGSVWAEAEHHPAEADQARLASLNQRDVREAARLKKKNPEGKKKRKNNPAGKRGGKKRAVGKRGGKKRVSGKRGGKKRAAGKKWGRKGKAARRGRRKGKAGKKGGRKRVAAKRGRRKGHNRKKQNKNQKKGGNGKSRNLKSINFGNCLTRTVKIMKMWKDVVTNFGRQKLRIERQIATGNNKFAKKKAFVSAYETLVVVGGGDKNNLSCDNSTTSKGAVQLKNITSFLGTCESEINKTCNTANWPQPNKTKLASCTELTKAFKIEAELCLDEMRLNTTAVCYCWNAASFNKTVEAVKDCKFSTEASNIAKAKENCTKKFGKCRKYEDDALLVVAACSTGNAAIKKKVRRVFNTVLLF